MMLEKSGECVERDEKIRLLKLVKVGIEYLRPVLEEVTKMHSEETFA